METKIEKTEIYLIARLRLKIFEIVHSVESRGFCLNHWLITNENKNIITITDFDDNDNNDNEDLTKGMPIEMVD